MSKNNNGIFGHKSNESSKNTSSARCKYSFNLLVEESQDGVLMPQQRISMSGDVEVSEVRTYVRAAVQGALDGLQDHLGGNNEDPAPADEEPVDPVDGPEPTEE